MKTLTRCVFALVLFSGSSSSVRAETWQAVCGGLDFTFFLESGGMNVSLIGDETFERVLPNGQTQVWTEKKTYVLMRGRILGNPGRTIVSGYIPDPTATSFSPTEPPVQIMLNRDRRKIYIFYTHPKTGRQAMATLCTPRIQVFPS
jgi:hypothetical protein